MDDRRTPVGKRSAGGSERAPGGPRHRAREVFGWWFRDRRTGRITIAQFPNTALWVFLGAVVARRLVPDGGAAAGLVDVVRTASLTWWALDEVFRGVNPWRRLLGVAGCASAITSVVALLR